MRTQENRLIDVTNSPARILVAEDETSLNDLLQDALRMNGYETISAKHGMEAVRLIREEKPDLVILDINMPQLDGFGVIEKLRNENNNIPIIVLTARRGRVVIGLIKGSFQAPNQGKNKKSLLHFVLISRLRGLIKS